MFFILYIGPHKYVAQFPWGSQCRTTTVWSNPSPNFQILKDPASTETKTSYKHVCNALSEEGKRRKLCVWQPKDIDLVPRLLEKMKENKIGSSVDAAITWGWGFHKLHTYIQLQNVKTKSLCELKILVSVLLYNCVFNKLEKKQTTNWTEPSFHFFTMTESIKFHDVDFIIRRRWLLHWWLPSWKHFPISIYVVHFSIATLCMWKCVH